MTDLYINGQLTVLPENFSITIIEENPFFTKNGKYTYDITLSLLDPVNARIYQHLNRMNKKGDIPKNRSAYLVVDNEVVLNGTEVILEYTESLVKIQLVSGNSELNFLIGGDRKLRNLDLGKAYIYEDLSHQQKILQVFQDLKLSYPERNWQFIPYCAGEGDINLSSNNPLRHDEFLAVGNQYAIYYQDIENNPQIMPIFDPFCSGSVPQPYLCFIIKKVLESLGYNLVYNAIENDSVLKNLYIVHGIQTLYFARMLPEWTVVEFFSKLEQWLNCEFIINPYDKTVKLMFNYQADDESNGSVTIDVLDEYTTENDNDDDKTVNNSNVAYSLDSEEYYKYMYLNSYIKEKAEVWNVFQLHELILMNELNELGYQYIFHPTNTADRFISYLYDKDNNKRTLKKVDSFRPLFNNPESEEIDIDLDIIPAAMKYTYQKRRSLNQDYFWIQIPIAGIYDPLIENNIPEDSNPDTDPINIQELLNNDSLISNDTGIGYSKMRLAVYSGLQNLDEKSNESGTDYSTSRYPIAYVEALAEYFPETTTPRYFGQKDVNPFRLDYLKAEIYSKSQSINTNKLYKLKYINNGKIDITSKFIANNKTFRCVKTERTVTNKGFDEIIKGEFYSYLYPND